MTTIPFTKMHGAGNDFVIIDNRDNDYKTGPVWAKKLADRRFGIGCDQLIVLEASQKADLFMRIYNPDGSESSACGNATRCVASMLMGEKDVQLVGIETKKGVLECVRHEAGGVTVNMGPPKWGWKDIPLSEPRNTEHLGIEAGGLADPVALSMGNPHMVFFVKDVNFVAMRDAGPQLEKHPLFPERANISAVQVVARDHLRAKVWERGVGETLACGSAACAIVVAGVRRGLCDRKATVSLPGGDLVVEWDSESEDVYMTGPVAEVFHGRFVLDLVV